MQHAQQAAAQQRRKIVAVVGDNNLDPDTLEPSMLAGDEVKKQQVAEEVG